MKNVVEAYFKAIKTIKPVTTAVAIYFSSVTGGIAAPADLGPAYWVQNLTSTVLFTNALGKMCADDESRPNMLIELGPHSALMGPIWDTLKGIGPPTAKIAYAPTVVRNSEPSHSLLDAAGAAYVRGAVLDMTEINFPKSKAKNRSFLRDLPRYPWQHDTRYWHQSRIADKHCHRDGKRDDILGTMALFSKDLEPTWRNIVRLDDVPWLREHRIQGMSVYPMAGYLAMAIEAAERRAQQHETIFSRFEFRELKVGAGLVLTDDVNTESVMTLQPYTDGTRGNSDIWDEFRICSWNTKRAWTEHCTGHVRVRINGKQQTLVSNVAETELKHMSIQTKKVMTAATYRIETQNMYRVLSGVGAGYGPCFQGLENCFSDPHHSRADLYLRDTKKVMYKEYAAPLSIHPVFLDALLHLAWPILGKGRMELEALYMPTMIRSLIISANLSTVPRDFVKAWCVGSPSLSTPQPTKFDLWATSQDSTEVLINMEGLILTPMKDPNADSGGDVAELCYKIEWQPLHDDKAIAEEERQEPIDHINGHAMEPNVLTNGHTTNGKLPDGCVVNGELINRRARDHIGQGGEVLKGLSEAISTETTNWKPSIYPLGEIDSCSKHVVVLQTGITSLRDLTVDIFDKAKRTLLNASHLLCVYHLDSPDAQMIVGLTRSLRSEGFGRIATFRLEAKDIEKPTPAILAAMDALWPVDGERSCKELDFRACGSDLVVPRVTNDTVANAFVHKETHEKTISVQPFYQSGRRFKLEIASPVSLDTLYFADDNVGMLGDNEIEIEVKATGLNFKDIVVAMGQPAQPWLGIECSGVVSSVGKNVSSFTVGQRVMALPEGAFSTYALSRATSAAPIPENI
ncbi:polyketide synthase dehydratase-domain-containing protein [Aspergillus minisclerotigenes]|uniref:Polyketide synthase dehydratase-domain-containing protein n=1 Tax=Aspergillus minisclerotigenes TaxID=656917 RepID=A0A5N6IZC6_9EURO|nr:polyketide synthase dehydratase-domain-containing protein [Aspergillus minisclerotigenes]